MAFFQRQLAGLDLNLEGKGKKRRPRNTGGTIWKPTKRRWLHLARIGAGGGGE